MYMLRIELHVIGTFFSLQLPLYLCELNQSVPLPLLLSQVETWELCPIKKLDLVTNQCHQMCLLQRGYTYQASSPTQSTISPIQRQTVTGLAVQYQAALHYLQVYR